MHPGRRKRGLLQSRTASIESQTAPAHNDTQANFSIHCKYKCASPTRIHSACVVPSSSVYRNRRAGSRRRHPSSAHAPPDDRWAAATPRPWGPWRQPWGVQDRCRWQRCAGGVRGRGPWRRYCPPWPVGEEEHALRRGQTGVGRRGALTCVVGARPVSAGALLPLAVGRGAVSEGGWGERVEGLTSTTTGSLCRRHCDECCWGRW